MLVQFEAGSVELNGESVDYTFSEDGELRIYLAELAPNSVYEITFRVHILLDAAGTTLTNTAILKGPQNEQGREIINEATVDIEIAPLGDIIGITPEVDLTRVHVLTINPHTDASHFFARFFEEWVNGNGIGANGRVNLNPLDHEGNPRITFEQV